MATKFIKVPDLGGASDVEVIELCVTNGDVISEGQSIVVVETDKASMEIPSPLAGKVISIAVSEGLSVSEGDNLIELEVEAAVGDSAANNAGGQDEQESENIADAKPADNTVASEAAKPSAKTVAINSEPVEVVVPDLGGAEQVELIEISVAVGDIVAEGDGLVVVETDKASMDIPSPMAGKIVAVLVKEGGNVAEGTPIVSIAAENTSGQVSSNEGGEAEVASQQAQVPSVSSNTKNIAQAELQAVKPDALNNSNNQGVYAGPAVRKLARELGVDLSKVTASGPKGRVAKEDLHNFVKQLVKAKGSTSALVGAGIPAVPDIDFSQFGEIDCQPMTKMHKLTAANMHRSWLNVPHVTQYDDADITDLEHFRKQLKPQMETRGIKISPLPFIVKAIASALQAYPIFNSSLAADGETIVYKKYINIGMAVDTDAGLLVPVIRDADKKGIWELSQEILELATKAKARKLKPAEMQGGCFTISSLGSIGGRGFTPIINTPEVGILGVSKLSTQAVFKEGVFVPRKMLPLALSYDHRAVNGGDAGRFMTFLVEQLSDVRHLIL